MSEMDLQGQKSAFKAHSCKEENKWLTQCQPRAFYSSSRHSHAVCTFQVHLPTSLCPALSSGTESRSQRCYQKWHHEL